jgi:hypothetical protein
MHHLKHRPLARAFWRSSFAYLLAFMSLFVTAGVVVYTYLQRSDENLQLLAIAIIVPLFLWILQWFTADPCLLWRTSPATRPPRLPAHATFIFTENRPNQAIRESPV